MTDTSADLRAVAGLLIRQHLALIKEGIGPKDPRDTDPTLMAWAVEITGDDFDDHDLWDSGLVPGSVHAPRCQRGFPHDAVDWADGK